MSHSTVLVIGENFEELLEPYNENTEVEGYWVDEYENPGQYWQTEKWIKDGTLPANPSMEKLFEVINAQPKDEDDDELRFHEGVIQRKSHYNPESKWDWWCVGGRWRGQLRLKVPTKTTDEGHLEPPHWSETMGGEKPMDLPENAADQARKRDIDIEGMRAEAAVEAEKRWDKFIKIQDKYAPLPIWSEVRTRWSDEQIDKARHEYHDHPGIKAIHFAELTSWMSGWEDEFLPYTKAAYLFKARQQAVPGFAILNQDGWFEQGHMGWFGMSDETKDSIALYLRAANQIIDSSPDDALFTVVDVHI